MLGSLEGALGLEVKIEEVKDEEEDVVDSVEMEGVHYESPREEGVNLQVRDGVGVEQVQEDSGPRRSGRKRGFVLWYSK